MRRVLAFVAVLAFGALGLQSPADGLSTPAPPLSLYLSPNALPAGNTFEVSGFCATDGATVRLELVRQARPGMRARVVQQRMVKVDVERNYKTTFTNNLATQGGFPVDAQVFAKCGDYTTQAAFVSTDMVFPRNYSSIMTVQDTGPCGLCVAHLKGFDAFNNLNSNNNFYARNWTPSGSLALSVGQDYTSYLLGSGPGSQARVDTLIQITPYGDFIGGVEVARADVKGDSSLEVITAPGPGGGPHVKVFEVSGPWNYAESNGFFAYPSSFTGGVRIAVGDVWGDDTPEIITAAGPGGGPHVGVFTPQGTLVSEFFAYAPNMTGGVSLAVGDIEPGGKEEIVTGAGPGGAPHVRTFNYAGNPIGNGFYAYDPSMTKGVWVAAGDVDRLGADEIVTGTGAGALPHVRWFTSPDGVFTNPGFYAYEDFPTGVRVAAPR